MKRLLTESNGIKTIYFGIFVFIFSLILFSLNDWNISKNSEIDLIRITNFSDFIGGVIGPVFSLVGIVLFYVALTEQRKDFETNKRNLQTQTKALEQQIKEFELQRIELFETRQVFMTQTEMLRKQQFESTFFNLINLHHNIINSMDLQKVEPKYKGITKLTAPRDQRDELVFTTLKGRDCFVEFRNRLSEIFISTDGQKQSLDFTNQVYSEFYNKFNSDLGHYFRNLYHLFKFIKNSEEKDKNVYASLLRSQLSNDELFLLFYNGISDYGKQKFKPLIEEFNLLKNISSGVLLEPVHMNFYNGKAYIA